MQADRQTDKQTDRQTDRQTRRQTDRHAGRHTHSLSVCVLAAEVVREQITYRDEDDDKMVVEPPVDRARVPSPDAAARAPSPSLAAHQPCPSVALLPAAARLHHRSKLDMVLADQRSACCPRDYFSVLSHAHRQYGKIVPWRGVAAMARQRGRAARGSRARAAAPYGPYLYSASRPQSTSSVAVHG